MITVLVGSDVAARKKRLAILQATLQKECSDVRTITDIDFNGDELRSLAGSTSLFGGTFGIILNSIADNADRREELLALLPALSESAHRFVISENALPALFMKKVAALKITAEEFEPKFKAKKEEVFNTFLLSDAIYDRKRSLAWPLYREAISLGLESRELHSKIFWAVKTMLIAHSSKTAGESGLNPFVYQKAKKGSVNYTEYELKKMLTDLSELFHEALLSGIDLEAALEAYILRSLEKKTLAQFARA